MWKRAGVDAEIFIVPAPRVRDTQFRQQFPGIEVTARGSQDAILTRLECGEQPTPQNRFSGNNRGHWCNQDYERLVGQYRGSLREADQGRTFKSIQDLVLDELPILLLNYQVAVVFARKGVTACQARLTPTSATCRLVQEWTQSKMEEKQWRRPSSKRTKAPPEQARFAFASSGTSSSASGTSSGRLGSTRRSSISGSRTSTRTA